MPTDRNPSARLADDLTAFLEFEYGIELHAAEEQHIFPFIHHCAYRPAISYPHGGWHQKPITRDLPRRIHLLRRYLRQEYDFHAMTDASVELAIALQLQLAPDSRRAQGITSDEVLTLLRAIDITTARGCRLRAGILLLRETWARPSEVLKRNLLLDVNASNPRGIAVRVPTSKTNPGPDPEYLIVEHNDDQEQCAVCALHDWVTFLGSDWDGPLMPGLSGYVPTQQTWKVKNFNAELSALAHKAFNGSRHLSAYSFRRGGATTAASFGWPVSAIRRKLRHETLGYIHTYVDTPYLFNIMRSVG